MVVDEDIDRAEREARTRDFSEWSEDEKREWANERYHTYNKKYEDAVEFANMLEAVQEQRPAQVKRGDDVEREIACLDGQKLVQWLENKGIYEPDFDASEWEANWGSIRTKLNLQLFSAGYTPKTGEEGGSLQVIFKDDENDRVCFDMNKAKYEGFPEGVDPAVGAHLRRERKRGKHRLARDESKQFWQRIERMGDVGMIDDDKVESYADQLMAQ